MGYGIGHRTYHTPVVRGPITQSIRTWTPLLVDECCQSLDETIGSPRGLSPPKTRLNPFLD
jgi:hypothetical protein